MDEEVIVYTKDYCGYCAQAKAVLQAKGVNFTDIDVTHDPALEAEMIERSGRRTVPQIFIRGDHIGGFDDLAALDATGELDRQLARDAAERNVTRAPIADGPVGGRKSTSWHPARCPYPILGSPLTSAGVRRRSHVPINFSCLEVKSM